MDNRRRVMIARARQAQMRNRQPQSSPLGLLNEGVARFGDAVVGSVGSVLNEATDAVGAGRPFSPTPASDMFDAVGIRRSEPEGIGERAIVGAGEAAAALIPAAATLRTIAAGAGPMANAARTLLAGMTTKTGAVSEIAAGAGAAAAGAAASESGPLAEGAATLAGGIVAGGGLSAIPKLGAGAFNAAMNTPAARTVRSAVAPFGRDGARIIAEDTFRGVAADRFAAADELTKPNVGNLTVAQRTGAPGIMGIERTVAAADPSFREGLEIRTQASRDALRGEISAPAEGRTPRDLRVFLNERIDVHREKIQGYLDQAERRLSVALRRVVPGRDREMASRWVMREVNKAFDEATATEAGLWRAVPRDVQIGTSNARQALAAAMRETTAVSADAIPYKARRFLGDGDEAFGDNATMAELHRLYSEMRRAGREAMAKPVPDEFAARQANAIAEAILKDVDSTGFSGIQSDTARKLADARLFSREMAEKFGQGNVAKIMARTRAGDDRVPDAEALRRTVGQPREAGGVAVDDFRRAGGEAVDAPIQDFLRDEFIDRATRADGTADPAAVERFARSNREALARFEGGVEKEVFDVRSAAREVARRGERVQGIVDALGASKRGTTAGVVNAPTGKEVARGIFEAENPAIAARTIARAAQRDPTGDAYLGLKAGIYDEVIRRSGGDNGLSGERMARALTDPQMRRVLRATLPEADLDRLTNVASQMRKIERSLAASTVDTENLPNNLLSTFVQVQAAKAGRAMGTGTIQVPGMFTARAREILGRMSNDRADALIRAALEDPKLMSDLLIGPAASRGRIRQAEERLLSWAVGTTAASVTEE